MVLRLVFSLLRVLLPLWVGAAVLFAINGSAEQRSPDFDSVVRAQLALIRFPAYYKFGFVCVGAALVLSTVFLLCESPWRRRLTWVTGLIAAALVLMVWDYFYIYKPMRDMLFPVGAPKPSTWVRLHATSMMTNLIQVSMCLAAAIILCWPRRVAGSAPPVGP